jgi:pyridoxine kinase
MSKDKTMKQKRVLVFEDYSCLGRCSLTVALPILSALGIETVGIPTAVLSNHTSGFQSWTFADLTSEILPSVEKWKDYNHHFDAIYTGYLGNGQVAIVQKAISLLKEKDTLLFVDPAMADNGKLYPGFSDAHINEMMELVREADLIVPNLSEAALLTHMPYEPEKSDQEYFVSLLKDLLKIGTNKALITGVKEKKDKIGMYYLAQGDKKVSSYSEEAFPGKYHGAGDIFASAFLGLLLNDISFSESLQIAGGFVKEAIKDTLGCDEKEVSYGLRFELALPYLLKKAEKK